MLQQTPEKPTLKFGPFRLDTDQRRLYRDDERVKVGGRAMDLLVALVENAGRTLSRNELEASVWPSSVVEESSLRVHIAALRRLLGDGIGEAKYIANVQGRGYSFIGPVEHAPPVNLPVGFALPEHRLPARMNPVIGREAVVEAIIGELPSRRLATVVGHGGIGKTALALDVANRLQPRYRSGACFLDLALISDPVHVTTLLASALGIPTRGEALQEAIDVQVKSMSVLIVIDNCEHVLDAAAILIEHLLRNGPEVNVLATSREPLDAEGERVFRLTGLASPPPGWRLSREEMLGYPAMQLLAERASASADTFVLSDENFGVAADLCRCLDGVPLAIEFAAARVGLLGLQGVAAQLDDRLRLLGSGRRTAMPRHRTLRALLDWSYDLLTSIEQRVFRECAVFKGTFTLKSAVTVLTDADLAPDTVRDCLVSIIAKSLISADIASGEASYSLLAITRAYALDRLLADPGYHSLARRHARHMMALMRDLEVRWESMDRAAWMRECQKTLTNARAALDWAFGPGGDPSLGIELTAAIMLPNFQMLGDEEIRDGASRMQAMAEAGVELDPVSEARMQIMLAQTFSGSHSGHAVQPIQLPDCFDRALERAEKSRRLDIELETLYHMTIRCFGWGDYQAAYRYAQRSSIVARRMEDEAAVVHSERLCAQSAHFLGDHATGRLLAERVLRQGHVQIPLRLASVVDRRVSMNILLARIMWLQGRGMEAAALASTCVTLADDEAYPGSRTQALCMAAIPIAFWRGELEQAGSFILCLERVLEQYKMSYWRIWLAHFKNMLALGTGGVGEQLAPPTMGKHIDHLATLGCMTVLPQARVRCEQGLVGWSAPEVKRLEGEHQLFEGNAQRAEATFQQAMELARLHQAPAWMLRSATSLAKLRIGQGRRQEARELLAGAATHGVGDPASADMRKLKELMRVVE